MLTFSMDDRACSRATSLEIRGDVLVIAKLMTCFRSY